MAKSSAIQHRYREVSLDPQLLNGFANEDRGALGGERVADEIQELFEKLGERVVWLMENVLTKRQAEIMRMTYLESKTQTETARILGLCQSSVHKSLMGNLSGWRPNIGATKRYGGAIKKMQKVCEEDSEIKAILSCIEELKKETDGTNS